jgi:hypothetical protein|eukprot:COSAG02_NODE_2639_length_8352_cov_5.696959_1_plen_265_part_00
MNESTVIEPCNGTGLINPAHAKDFHRWAFASIDWSNAKNGPAPVGWAKQRPMDAEHSLVEQAALLKAANPKQHVGIYRNIVKALPWFPAVAEKLRDPSYSGWFLKFKDNTSAVHVPRCDSPHLPQQQLCSDLYHDQLQTPHWPPKNIANDGNCSAPGCDCGGVPCGEYLWNHHNESMVQWLIEEHILGSTAIGNENISAIYLDDNWQNFTGGESKATIGGPTEEDNNCTEDMGLTQADTTAMTEAWRRTMVRTSIELCKGQPWY